MKKQLWIGIVLVLTVWACNRSGAGLQEIDLMPFGIAATIKAPADTMITAGSLGDMQEAVIRSKDSTSVYSLQVLQAPATALDLAAIVAAAMEEVKADTLAQIEILDEAADGFLYAYAYDEAAKGYDFRRYRLQGDRLITFQTTFGIFHSEEAARMMYKAVAQ